METQTGKIGHTEATHRYENMYLCLMRVSILSISYFYCGQNITYLSRLLQKHLGLHSDTTVV